MSKLFMFEKPLGMRDTFPHLYEAKHTLKKIMEETVNGWGYRFIETPTLEYYETVGEASAILDQQLFKLLDQQGHTLVLRPDMTAPIARVAASKLLKDERPLRLAYTANVFRAQQREGGRPAEFEQVGIECIGDASVSADGEVIALMVSVLRETGLKNFKISIGHIGFVHALFKQILGTEERANILRRYLYEKNYVGYRRHIENLSLSSIDKKRLLSFLNLRGEQASLDKAFPLLEGNEEGRKALAQLQELWAILCDFGVEDFVKFDLSLVSHMSYYSGILFEVYADNVGYAIGNGGRYNKLLEKFGKQSGATGFALRVDYTLEALGTLSFESDLECVLFSAERRKEAIELAGILRKQGKKVVLQDWKGIDEVDDFSKRFSDVHYFIGRSQRQVDDDA
ncbi:ATP phosphoribosyltransferase regulatory subunit [Bacillus pakistanensis]|uniref:ATP phosphoribosyltransferase regulatory subunit n=1 Tax=Rossellomorea pakistanensis TaxID=992288 RepID=A0ABS2NDQ3_9BACI|nr:ATP phosphoribosyltransferase regulatory subunit [Bacillus pakistanensis]MBM7585982.1 ATP phosphoribosyltransferase regulatory subunit [Bacillus pakistanensis]